MFLKYFIYLSSFFLEKTNTELTNLENKTLIMIKKTIRTEILFAAFNILIGIILSSIIIFSLFQVAKNFQIYVSQFENNVIIEICSFSALAVTSFILIFYLLRKDKQKLTTEVQDNTIFSEIKIVGLNFIEGAVKGFNSKK